MAPLRVRSLLATALLLPLVAACSATPVGGSTSSGSTNSAPVSVPGVTAETVTLSWGPGLMDENSKTNPAQYKVDTQAVQAVVDAFNEAGGLLGRKVEVLATDKDPGNKLGWARMDAYTKAQGLPLPDPTNGAEVCDAYAGTDVFALLYPVLVAQPLGTPAGAVCLNKAGHPIVGIGAGWSAADYKAAPASAGFAVPADRSTAALIAGGKAAGVIGSGKVAVVTDSTKPADAFSADLKQLADAGVADPLVLALNPAMEQAEALSTVVKLADQKVSGVVFLTDATVTPGLLFLLLPALEQQQFYPKLLTLDASTGAVLQGLKQVSPQVTDAMVSYVSVPEQILLPDEKEKARRAATPAGQLCAAAAKAKPAVAEAVSLQLCDSLTLLKAALTAGGDQVSATAFEQGLGKLSDYTSPSAFAVKFAPGQHAGGAGITRVVYSSECQCESPSGGIVTF